MTANVEVARQAEAPGAVISRGPGEPLQPRQTRRQRDAILIMILLAAAARSARQVEAPDGLIRPGPGGVLQPRPASRQRDAILIVTLLAAAANLALQQGATFVIVLAAVRGLVREGQPIRRALSWYFRPVSTGHRQGLKRRYLRQQMLDAPTG
ncbi:MAG: hypothetical protein ACLQDY_21445 [Streptosporangiaceae bacterium]|jgi:hypothetical protein